MDLRFVTLAEIDLDDGTFEIRRFTGSTRLRESLGRFGILDPAWLRERSGKYTLVDGFQRLGWAKENGVRGAVCRIFPEDCDVRELWTRRIEKKIFEREINLAEKAQIMSVLLGLFQPEEIPGFFFSGLNVAKRPEVLRKWASLSDAGSEILAIFASGVIAERAALEVAGRDARSRDCVLRVLEALRCSASIQVEIVERINEIAIREEKAGADIIEDSRVREILGSKELNHRQKTQALRDFLGELRHPRLSARQKRFQQEIEALGLPPEARIIPPVYFEGNNWRMELSFTGPDELRKIFESAGSSVKSDRLNILFKAQEQQR
jgi:ParB family chromosome partitioning protein